MKSIYLNSRVITIITAGLLFTIFVTPYTKGDEIVAWGDNSYGEGTPPAGNNFIAIAAGRYISFALTSDSSIVGWGYNASGLATPPAGNNFIAIAAGDYHGLALTSDGSITGWGDNQLGQATTPSGNNFIAIAAGDRHSLALKSDGTIVAWGCNNYGQCNVPAGNNYTAIAAGSAYSLALKSDGSIVGWGLNNFGQATPPIGNDFTAIAAGDFHSLALKSDGSIIGWNAGGLGIYNYGQATPPGGNNFIAISAGFRHSLALTSDGSIVGWGFVNWATPPSGNNFTAIAAGYAHSLTLRQVPEPTIPPTANAGSDQTVMDNDDNGFEEITLDGSVSSDSDGTIVSWVWTDDLGDMIPDGHITTAPLSVGTHTITLTVTDDDGLTGTDTVAVIVEEYPNQPPVADANGPYIIHVGDTLTLNASGSSDYDNDIVSYLWDLDDNNTFETDAGNQAVFDVNSAYLQSIGLLIDNPYNIRLKVTDSAGQNDTDTSTLTILPAPAMQVFVDIKPGSCPNPVNVKSSGILTAAVLGSIDYDILAIDPSSIRLAGVEPLRSNYEDVAAPPADTTDCNCTTDGPDGLVDLILKFKTQKIAEAIGEVHDGDVLPLKLTGIILDPVYSEMPIEGTDCIQILERHKPFNKADINRDGIVDAVDYAIFAQNWLQCSLDPQPEY